MTTIQFTQEELYELVERALDTARDYLKDEKWTEADSLLRQILRVNPSCQPALRMLSQVLMTNKKGQEAIPYYTKILDQNPTDFEALNNIALCYGAAKDTEKAIEHLKKCLDYYPNMPAAYWNLALQYKDKDDYETCFKVYEKGINRIPGSPELKYNYAIGLAEKLHFKEAIAQYEAALTLNPEFSSARFNLSLIQLLLGNYKEGWENYEARFEHAPVFKKFKQRFTKKEWGGENGNGETVLVYNEQGAGDTVQFARFLPKLKEKGYKVILEVLPELVEIMAKCPGVDQVVPQRYKKTPEYDYHISIGSLPRFLDIDFNNDLWNGAYLAPTGEVPDAFKDYKKYFKIGICWAGNPVHRNDKNRSTFLKYFKCLGDLPNVRLFSLQKDARPRYWSGKGVVDLTEECNDMSVVDMGDMLIDFNYTAAIMKNMDAIVTVDTAVAHIAGSMGLKCYLLLPWMPDWRWGMQGNSCPWYPSIEIIRQLEPGDYQSRLKKIAYEIRG